MELFQNENSYIFRPLPNHSVSNGLFGYVDRANSVVSWSLLPLPRTAQGQIHELIHLVDFDRHLNLRHDQIHGVAGGLVDLLRDPRNEALFKISPLALGVPR